jgi:hypothetical protein
LVALLGTPLEVEVEYQVASSGVVNINGVPEGGGDAGLLLPRSEPVPGPVEPATDVPPAGIDAPGAVPDTTPGGL